MLFLGEVKEKLADDDAVTREIALEVVYVLVAFFPNMFGNETVGEFLRAKKCWMNANDEDFLVVRAVENANFAAFGNDFVVAPKIVVIQFFVTGRFEGVDIAALRIHARHDVLDDAIFSCGVHALKNEQKRPPVLRVKHFLEVAEAGDAVFEQVLCGVLVLDVVPICGIVILQAKLFAFGNTVRFDDARAFLQQFVVFHGAGSVVQRRDAEQKARNSLSLGEP